MPIRSLVSMPRSRRPGASAAERLRTGMVMTALTARSSALDGRLALGEVAWQCRRMSFRVDIIGAGPSGLMAAEVLAKGGVKVRVIDHMASPARKFLMAGR